MGHRDEVIASVLTADGERHGVLRIAGGQLVCENDSQSGGWSCPVEDVSSFECVEDEVTWFRVRCGDAVITVLRALGDQGAPDEDLGRRLREIAEANECDSGHSRRADARFTRELMKRSMP